MTSYFDDVNTAIYNLRTDDNKYDTIKTIEEKLVGDCTVCAMMPGFPDDLRKRVHEVVLKHAVYCLPLNAPPKDFETWEDHVRIMRELNSDLHTVFHDVARSRLDRFSDSPTMPLRCLYADGETEREQILIDNGTAVHCPWMDGEEQ